MEILKFKKWNKLLILFTDDFMLNKFIKLNQN
jgi:hypothetical protein